MFFELDHKIIYVVDVRMAFCRFDILICEYDRRREVMSYIVVDCSDIKLDRDDACELAIRLPSEVVEK